MEDTTKLNTSKLGTKEYWDEFYALEKKNFEHNPQDTGECWFEDNGAEAKMVQFLEEHVGIHRISLECSMVDLGTGNGHLLFELLENGFHGDMLGIDYSSQSVEFATKVAQEKDYNIQFSAADIFDANWNPGKYDLVLDKGTLDAIALSGLKTDNGRSLVESYSKVVEKLLFEDGVFLITSCNFTESELIKILQTDNLKSWDRITYPSFSFGGVQGSAICSIAFVKQN
ncbi:probable N-lysine methyltransferase SEE1 [Zygosaccharomyces bailii]|nr:probable N-lysine methyltransferase SEE1 [Zygosaccharomyces bailii]